MARRVARPSTPQKEEIRRLFGLRHPNPHSLLGAHPSKEGVVVRAFRPDAREVHVLRDGHPAHRMRRVDKAGLFEFQESAEQEVFPYRLEIRSTNGGVQILHDPYTFLPTLGDLDLHLAGEGRHERLHERMGAHVREISGIPGVSFAVWAPEAQGVSVVGDFNGWDGRLHTMRNLGASGIWELFIPGLGPGTVYKFEIRSRSGPFLKADPFAFRTELPPATASIIHSPAHRFEDAAWIETRAQREPARSPLSIYEVHLGSWKRVPEEDQRMLTYAELADQLAAYASDLGFTHVELLPVMEHPFAGSWGYQSSSYFAPTARHGSPDEFRLFVDQLHRQGLGVILDWAPAHFPKDAFGLGRFDGTALYEHADPREGEHPDWGTYIFNYGRHEVRNFLLSSALFWLSDYHADGLRIDAVASMLYRDYSRNPGEWVPNIHGGRENLEAIAFLRRLNELAHAQHPGVLMVAEESTAWPGVSHPTYAGGLGFGFKWNMGWMHDTLLYFAKDPVYRRFHHRNLTFGLLYAYSENFILPLSHDEVVHEKGSLLGKMPGGRAEKFANLRALYGYMWAHPGKKLLFMGGEFGQAHEWAHDESLDWHLLADPAHGGIQSLVRDLNRIYRGERALWEADGEAAGFRWIDANDADSNAVSFIRWSPSSDEGIVCVGNFSPVLRTSYRVGLPRPGRYTEILNTDSAHYGGTNAGNAGGATAEAVGWHGLPWSASIVLPPLSTIWLRIPRDA